MRLVRVACSSLLVLVLCLTSLAHQPQSQAAGATKLVVISWDGAADWVVDKLLAEGRLPSLARLASRGARAASSQPAFPSKTACGHAAIWTGAYSDVNGVSGNAVPLLPRSAHTLLEKRSGFDSASLLAEPLWITALKAGKRVAVLSATHVFPEARDLATLREAGIPPERFVSFSGFEHSLDPARVLTEKELVAARGWTGVPVSPRPAREAAFRVGDAEMFALVVDDPSDPTGGYDTVIVRQGSRDAARATASATLKPRPAAETTEHFSARFRITKGDLFGYTYFRLFDLAPDGSRMTLYRRGVSGLQGAASRETVVSYLDAYGGFHDDVFFSLYQNGDLGAPIVRGGDGTAERRLVEIVRLDVELLKRGTRYALETWRPDLLFHYTPMTDSAGHSWVGVLDPESPAHDPALAERLWPFYTEVFRLQDEWLGAVLDAVDERTVVAVVSDHGMAGTATRFLPNAVLARAGLVAVDQGGQIDLSRTKACVPPWSDFFVTVNGTDWKGGIVPPAERDAVLDAAERALLDARDPQTGAQIVTAVLRAGDLDGLGMGGPTGGDLYLELASGYYPIGDVGAEITRQSTWPGGSGTHGFLPLRRSMQAIFYVGGGPVPHGIEVPGVRQIDIAPTLSRLLSIPAPRDARGHAIGAIVAPLAEKAAAGVTREP